MTAVVALFMAICRLPGSLVAEETVALELPDGFKATLFADDDLAHDIFSMTLDSQGRVVVAGRGYVQILLDEDGDGRADSFQQFADGPKNGAQGMYFHGRDLLCLGDAGLLRYRDKNGDDRADGKPDRFLTIKTGVEHGAHAIRKGPDGWWYLIAGNAGEVTGEFATLPRSPVKYPRAGALLRLKPDLTGGQILADGFRNAYDFDFTSGGDIFTFDSDGERDISLPWYRPTRVFHVLPGSDAGWVSRSWKRPDYFLDMPPVVASFGRGSPTGVVCYRHRHFPAKYHGALFVQDWTFGRVYAVLLNKDGSTFSGTNETFISGKGEFGFAPTDIEVGPDGSLYVCVGGRGTRGGVYRITFTGEETKETDEKTDDLTACLQAPQPLSSWSRAQWEPLARQLGPQPFHQAILENERPAEERVRAVEIVTELFEGVPTEIAQKVIAEKSPEVRAAVAWSWGRLQEPGADPKILKALMTDLDPLVRRKAIDAIATGVGSDRFDELLPALSLALADRDRFVRHAVVRAMSELDDETFRTLGKAVPELGWGAIVSNSVGYLFRRKPEQAGVSKYAVEAARLIILGKHDRELKLRATRLMQLGLGGLSQRKGIPAAMTGYSSAFDLQPYERDLDSARAVLADVFPTGDKLLDHELGRLIAVLSSYNPELLTKVLDQITSQSSPTDDIHHLLIAGRIPVTTSTKQREAVAQALVNIELKISARKMNKDNNWTDRIREMYLQLVEIDPEMPGVLIEQPGFGNPGHIVFFGGLTQEQLPIAVGKMMKVIQADQDYHWTNDVVFTLASVKTDEVRQFLREQYDHFAIRDAVTIALAAEPVEQDRSKFYDGLKSAQFETLRMSLEALEKLPSKNEAGDILPLVRLLRRLGRETQDDRLREQVVRLLRRATNQNFSFVFGKSGYLPQPQVVENWTQWTIQTYPDAASQLLGGDAEELNRLREQLSQVDWEAGDVARGEKLFHSRACAQCHGGGKALGPDLAGVASRFSREDLFTAISQPSRDVSPRYQTTMIETSSGKIYTGLIIYQSVDGVTLRDGTNQTYRIEADELEVRRQVETSLMPTGLLNDLQPNDLADLYRYLQSLSKNKP